MDAVSYSHSAKQAKRIKKIINEPDSTSGVVTVPKVIPAGETITIPAGRTAVLPNVQIDGTLTVDGDLFVPSGATAGDLENQIALKSDTTYVDAQVATKATLAEAQSYDLGVGQTWQDVTANRSLSTIYTNSTGKPIAVSLITDANNASCDTHFYIDNIMVFATTSNWYSGIFIIIPNGSNYKVEVSNTARTITSWYELR